MANKIKTPARAVRKMARRTRDVVISPVESPMDAMQIHPDRRGRDNGDLGELIEAERVALLEAHSLMKCLGEVLLKADLEEAVFYADLAHVAAKIVDESVARLDDTRLAPMLAASRPPQIAPSTAQSKASPGRFEVRESKVVYLC